MFSVRDPDRDRSAPVDTSDSLSDDAIRVLAEAIAETVRSSLKIEQRGDIHIRDLWPQEEKNKPSRAEQEYDKRTALRSLSALTMLGYTVQPKLPPERSFRERFVYFLNVVGAMCCDAAFLVIWAFTQQMVALGMDIAPPHGWEGMLLPAFQVGFATSTAIPVLAFVLTDISIVLRNMVRTIRRHWTA
jgi:hypothetical protein